MYVIGSSSRGRGVPRTRAHSEHLASRPNKFYWFRKPKMQVVEPLQENALAPAASSCGSQSWRQYGTPETRGVEPLFPACMSSNVHRCFIRAISEVNRLLWICAD